MNLYAYTEGNPVNLTDPTGLFALPWFPPIALPTPSMPDVDWPDIDWPREDDQCENRKDCPPCEPFPVGTIGYRGPQVHNTGIDAGTYHYHLYEVQQIRSTCECIWKERTKAITGNHHVYELPPIDGLIDLNDSPGRVPRYPY